MADIVLATLNAKYLHAAFGLRYLHANLGPLQPRAQIAEFDINQRPLDIAGAILASSPRILGLGVYIWNVSQTTEVLAVLKKIRPDIIVILGGPEVSFETESQAIVALADHVITGEADLKFAEVCLSLLDQSKTPPTPLPKIIHAPIPDVSALTLPYSLYTPADLAHRIVYVEVSRGCPFTCEFCLSSLDIPVRQFALPAFLNEMDQLIKRGLTRFKFVDRTFNLNIATSRAILEFFLERYQPGFFFHFEMIPDRLPLELRAVIARFPPGALQFEVGIQTFNPEVGRLISRRQNEERLNDHFRFLRQETGVHIHADLIVGLPGESLENFGAGFDRLVALGPQEIQVGILKRLRGTPITRHDAEWQMIYSPQPPYEILQNKLLDFATLQRLRRFARFWDLLGNSGNFVQSLPLLWTAPSPGSPGASPASPFQRFLELSDWLYNRLGRTDTIALGRLAEALHHFLAVESGLGHTRVAAAIWKDWQQAGRRDPPESLRPYLDLKNSPAAIPPRSRLPRRQARHLGAADN